MMFDAQSEPSLTTVLLALLGGGGLAALIGAINHWRRQPAEVRQITTQTKGAEADIIHKSVEASVRTGEFTLKALEMAEATIDRLTARKEALESTLEHDIQELREKLKEVDEKQADIFLFIGEQRKAEKQGDE